MCISVRFCSLQSEARGCFLIEGGRTKRHEEKKSLYREEAKIDLNRLSRERVERPRAQIEKEGFGAYLYFDPTNLNHLTDMYTVSLEPLLSETTSHVEHLSSLKESLL